MEEHGTAASPAAAGDLRHTKMGKVVSFIRGYTSAAAASAHPPLSARMTAFGFGGYPEVVSTSGADGPAAAAAAAAENLSSLGHGINVVMTAAGGLLVVVGFIAFGIWLCGRASAESARVAQQVKVLKPGLSREAIARIPIVSGFKNAGGGGGGGGDACAVCLGELDDRVRVLPRCSHAFHAECIDMWLFSHKTCPTCRSDLSVLEQHQQQQPQQQQQQQVVILVDSR